MFDESPSDAYALRFGAQPQFPLPDLDKFLNHRSIRAYKPDAIPESVMTGLVAAAQSASTSSSLQLWSVVSAQGKELREDLAIACGDQNHIRQAAWFLAFIADHHRLRQAAHKVGEEAEGLDYAEFFIAAVVDAALAAERLVCAAESLGIGVCYIGGLRNNVRRVQELLNLPPGAFGVFGLCLGYPAEPVTSDIKPRLSQSDVWFREAYRQEIDVTEYDERMSAFYESQNMKGDVTWSMRSGRRVDNHHLTGREIIKDWLIEQGFCRR